MKFPDKKGGNALFKREYLQQYQLIQQEIQRLLAEKSRWEELARQVFPIPAHRADIQFLVPPNLLSPALAGQSFISSGRALRARENIFLWEARIAQEVDGLLSLRRAIDDAIRSLPDPESQLVLKYRYIDGLTIEEIASQMHYCERHISRLHESALRAIRLPGCVDDPPKPHLPKSRRAV